MIRKRNPKAVKRSVVFAITVLEKVQVEFGIGSKFLLKNGIHKSDNKYFRVFINAVNYLEELRGANYNPLRNMLEDYFTCICEYFEKFNRQPTTFNYSPSPGNRVKFLEWIEKFEYENQENYWIQQEIKSELEFTEVELEIIENCEVTEV